MRLNRIGRRTIICMAGIIAIVILWKLLEGLK